MTKKPTQDDIEPGWKNARFMHSPATVGDHLSSLEQGMLSQPFYARAGDQQEVMVVVTTLMNGAYPFFTPHDEIIRLLARYCDKLLEEPPSNVAQDLEFLAARVALTHAESDRWTGIQAWPWPHDLVDECIRRALNMGLWLGTDGPTSNGHYHDVVKVVTTWPEI